MNGQHRNADLHLDIYEAAMTTPKVKPIPDGYHSITPYLIFKDAPKAIDFCKQAFGAVEVLPLNGPDGRVGHAELRIGDSVIMLADESPEMGARAAVVRRHAGVDASLRRRC